MEEKIRVRWLMVARSRAVTFRPAAADEAEINLSPTDKVIVAQRR
jgi:hypothetical protein